MTSLNVRIRKSRIVAAGPACSGEGAKRTVGGQRFLLNVPVDETADSPAITVVLNWAAGLRR
jgi:hypothetical protein